MLIISHTKKKVGQVNIPTWKTFKCMVDNHDHMLSILLIFNDQACVCMKKCVMVAQVIFVRYCRCGHDEEAEYIEHNQ